MISCTRKLRWEAAHRVMRHESKCAHLHGHSYSAEITCTVDALDSVGRVVDFGVIKASVGAWIDETWDHGTLVNGEDLTLMEWLKSNGQRYYSFVDAEGNGIEPTAENIAAELLYISRYLLEHTEVSVVGVIVHETVNCSAGVM